MMFFLGGAFFCCIYVYLCCMYCWVGGAHCGGGRGGESEGGEEKGNIPSKT